MSDKSQAVASDQEMPFRHVALSALVESPLNPRQHFDAAALEELTASVKAKGVLVPLLVRPVNGHFEIVAGARRFRAAKAAKLAEVPVLVREIDDLQALEAATIENLQRADVHPLDEALGYQALMARAHYEVDAIAAKVGKSASYVYQRLQLLKLVEPLRELFVKDELTAGHAVELARLTPADQAALMKDDRDGLFEYSWQGGKMQRVGVVPVRALRNVIQRTFHLDLARAPWGLEDAQLVPASGACSSCPKRTGANPALFADIAKANTCTDRACYEQKQRASAERTRAKLAAKGERVVLISDEYGYSGNDTKRLEAAGILRRNDYGAGKQQTGWREAGKQKCPHLAKGVVADGRTVGTVHVVCTEPGKCPVHARRLDERTGSSRSTAEHQKHVREQRIKATVNRQVLEAVLAKIPHPLPLEDLRAVVRRLFERLYNPMDRDVVKALGWLPEAKKGARPDHDKAFRDHLPALTGPALAQMAVRLLLWAQTETGGGYYGGESGGSLLRDFATRYKVDAAAIERQVRAAEKAKEKPKAAGRKPPLQTSAKRRAPAKQGKKR